MEEKYYSTKQACSLLGVKVRTVRQWISDGKIKACKYGISNHWFIPEREIRRLRNGNKD